MVEFDSLFLVMMSLQGIQQTRLRAESCTEKLQSMTHKYKGREWSCSAFLVLINVANLGFNLEIRFQLTLYLYGGYRLATIVIICKCDVT
jgi:hypothetical protein